MIRFSPDSFLEGVLRPFLMALPQGWVYTEIVAPDFRFALSLVVLVVSFATAVALRRQWAPGRPLWVALISLVCAFILWLLSGGNGRYFMPFLVLIGPLLVVLIYRSPFGRQTKHALLLVALLVQGAAISTNSPWAPFNSLAWTKWKDRDYFKMDVEAASQELNVTYLTFAGQTHSLISPLFPPSSRWINLYWFEGHDFLASQDPVVMGVKLRMRHAENLQVLLQSQPNQADSADGGPDEQAQATIRRYINQYGLRLVEGRRCRLIQSETMASAVVVPSSAPPEQKAAIRARAGFWACPVAHDEHMVAPSLDAGVASRAKRVLERVESMCPRMFPAGQISLKQIGSGVTRSYSASDSTLTFLPGSGAVYVKFLRALNPQFIGREEQILQPDFRVNCDGFVSREGLPWKRTL